MVRSAMLEHGVGGEAGFRWRGREVSRLEGLSDAVFGFAITLLVVLMYLHAWRLRDALGLDEVERFDTRADVRTALLNVGVGVLSICVAVFGRGDASLAAAGFTYALLGPLMTADGVLRGRRRRRLLSRHPADGPALPAAAAG